MIPETQRSASSGSTAASSRADASRLRAITGIITFSSKFPAAPPNATAASFPITCVHTWQTASQMTGFTLPGMIEEPGCRSGRAISPRPARGPEPIQRRSLQILYRLTAITRSTPLASTSASRPPAASKWFRASVSGSPVEDASRAMTRGGELRRRVEPGSCRGPAEGQLAEAGQDRLGSFGIMTDRGRVPAELLSEGHRHGVHEMGPPGLDHRRELGGLGLENAAARWFRAGISSRASSRVAARAIAEGNTSLDDWDALTWSFGCTGAGRARATPGSR